MAKRDDRVIFQFNYINSSSFAHRGKNCEQNVSKTDNRKKNKKRKKNSDENQKQKDLTKNNKTYDWDTKKSHAKERRKKNEEKIEQKIADNIVEFRTLPPFQLWPLFVKTFYSSFCRLMPTQSCNFMQLNKQCVMQFSFHSIASHSSKTLHIALSPGKMVLLLLLLLGARMFLCTFNLCSFIVLVSSFFFFGLSALIYLF